MTTIDQTTAAQIAQPDEKKEKLLWLFDKPAWMVKKSSTSQLLVADQDTFYRRAIEWSHRADKVINLILGYLLAVASVLGFMDVLSGGEVLGNVPYLFYVWLGVMGLGVEFQIFLVIGRMPDLSRTVQNGFFRFVFFAFNAGFLAFLCYMSVVIAAVFTQHRDVAGSTIGAAMAALGIDPTRFVFERAALATLLLVLMAIDRTMERWRMQIDQAAHVPTQEQNVPVVPAQVPVHPQEDKFEQLLNAVQAMQAIQVQSQQQFKMTIERIPEITRVTVEALIEDRLSALPTPIPVPLLDVPSTVPSTEELDAVNVPVEPISYTENTAELTAKNKRYGEAILQLAAEHPEYTGTQIAAQIGCTEKTAYKWMSRVNVPE